MDLNSISNNSDNSGTDYPGTNKINTEDKGNSVDQNICTCGKNPGGPCKCKTGEGCNHNVVKAKPGDNKNCDNCPKKNRLCCTKGTHKLEVFDWLSDLPESQDQTQMVEVQFKNTRKGYYLNSNNLELFKGDIVAVEASPGHDIGEVTLTGKLVMLQMKKNNYRPPQGEQHRRVYRIAKPIDMEKYAEAKALEHRTMLRSREIAEEMGLLMKISDVEYQGDGNKAIFYYIADERVDFRQLIKVYAEQFRVKIEMKQIGARQEAGRVGGIGPCGRELCCSSSMSNFVSVSTAAARYQDISLNPQKLAGQCGKLKCCLNYEVDTYVEAQRQLPSREIVLDTKDGSYYHFKTDILSGMMTYSSDRHFAANLSVIPKDRVYEIIRMNKTGHKPLKLDIKENDSQVKEMPKDILEQENINRFDNNGNNNNKNNSKKRKVAKGDRKQQHMDASSDNNKERKTEKPEKQEKPENGNQNVTGKGGNNTPKNSGNKHRNNRHRNRSRNDNKNNQKDSPASNES